MRFLNASITNFGVFQGHHHFDFTPVNQGAGKNRHITIITGHNGAGKSTLFQALRLALYGGFILENPSQQDYSDFLLGRLHTRNGIGMPIVSDMAEVDVDLFYVLSGEILNIRIERRWERTGARVGESLTVLSNGRPPDVPPSDYQAWLNDLIPPAVDPLCFFDAERLDSMSSAYHYNGSLGNVIRRLLGLDLVDRLRSDLRLYSLRLGKGQKGEQLKRDLNERAAVMQNLETQVTQLVEQVAQLQTEEDRIRGAIRSQESLLAAEGGGYAVRRGFLQERQSELEKQIANATNQMREYCGALLPFALVPNLCKQLDKHLEQEIGRHREELLADYGVRQVDVVKEALQDDKIWDGLEVSPATRKKLWRRLIGRLERAKTNPSESRIEVFAHNLGATELELLKSWIDQVSHAVPIEVSVLGKQIREFREEQRRIEADIKRAPDEQVLAPIHQEIGRLEHELAIIRQQRTKLDQELGGIKSRLEGATRQHEQALEQRRLFEAGENRLELAQRAQRVLRVYQADLTQERLNVLANELLVSFNAICRKENLLKGIHISPEDFHVQLEDSTGQTLPVSKLSAGERELYVLALLAALRQVSGRDLPLAIDTPLARLDDVHRQHIVRSYLPQASRQVLLFTTNAEMDMGLLADIEPYRARTYYLTFDSRTQGTLVTQDSPESSLLARANPGINWENLDNAA